MPIRSSFCLLLLLFSGLSLSSSIGSTVLGESPATPVEGDSTEKESQTCELILRYHQVPQQIAIDAGRWIVDFGAVG